MNKKLQNAVAKTIAYSDIFDYPLRISELHQYLIDFQLDDPSKLSFLFTDYHGKKHGLSRNGLTQIQERNGYFFLQWRDSIVGLRQEREKISQEKIKRARKVLHVLKHVFFIKMVVLTGAVAAGNAEQNSDIDVLIVAQKKRLWLARLAAILLMELKGARRPPPPRIGKDLPPGLYKDKFCLNMFVSEENLELPNKDLFTANEFARMKVVWEKNQTYEQFVKANGWVREFLPNWKTVSTRRVEKINPSGCFWGNLFESLARFIQLKYMERRKTTEVVANGLLMFHPKDAREWVMREYEKRIKGGRG